MRNASGKRIITLTTDFGTENWFAGTIKGVIKNINPDVEIVDISHNVRQFNVRHAAFTLLNSFNYFPEGAVHVVVVDPGVGSERLGIAVKTENYLFVAPDNGVLSYAIEKDGLVSVVSLENRDLMLDGVSSTFHGRDIFAPAAAYLSLGVEMGELGPTVEHPAMLEWSVPCRLGANELLGHVIYVDHFGNCITDVARSCLEGMANGRMPRRVRIKVRDNEIRLICGTYSDGKAGELICLFGSSGYLEFSTNRGNASQDHKIEEGGEFILRVP